MKFAYLIATSMVAAVAADDFYWKPNNNFGTVSNWEVEGGACNGTDTDAAECPTVDRNDVVTFQGAMVIPDASECDKGNNWGGDEGRVLKMDMSVNIGALILPADGKIMLGDDIVMTFDEDLAEDVDNLPETNWKCKSIHETNWKCGANWATDGFSGDSSHRVPCASDTVIFPDDSSAYQVNVPANTFVSSMKIERGDGEDLDIESAFVANDGNYQMRTQSEVDRFFSVYENQFQGGVASVGDECGSEEQCEEFCHNHCADLDDDAEAQRVDLFDSMETAKERADVYADGVENGKVPDVTCGRLVTIGQSSDKITDYRAQEAAFNAKYAGLFAPYVETFQAQEIGDVFASDLYSHMTDLGNAVTYDFSPGNASPCTVTSRGGVDCSGLESYQTSLCQVRDVTSQVFYALDAYFCQGDECTAPNGIVVEGVRRGRRATTLPTLNTGNGKPNQMYQAMGNERDIDLSFGFSDADFFQSRYAKGVYPKDFDNKATGFMTRSNAETVGKSLDMGYAATLLNEYDALDSAGQVDFQQKVVKEVMISSVVRLPDNEFVLFTKAVPVDADKAHKFDQARFQIKFNAENLPNNFDEASLRSAFAVAMWAVVSTDLKPNYAANELNKYSSTTVTTSSTTTITTSTTTPFFDVETGFDEAQKSIIEAATKEDLVFAKDQAEAAVSKARTALAADPSNAELMAAFQKANEALVQAKRDFEYFVIYSDQKAIDDAAAASAAAAAGGLPIIPIAAGAGGVIVILIVIIVVMSGGNNDGGSNAGPGTSVVAFENPMYDDPSSNDRANPVFDEEQGGGDEGLYDEPAFNDAGDGAGGYLDVEPDEESESEEEASASEEESDDE